MTPPGKSAALRRPAREDADERIASEVSVRQSAGRGSDAASDTLVVFPRPPSGRTAHRQPAPVPVADRDLAAELESALMNDLESMVALFDQAAREPDPVAPARPSDDPDQQALDRLLASIRQGDSAPVRTTGPLTNDTDVVISHAAPEPPVPKERLASPRPSGRSDTMAPPSARPKKARRQASRAEPQPALQLAMTSPRRIDRRLIIGAATALVLVAGLGAVMTVRGLTARSDAPVVTTETASPAPAPVTAAVPAESIAPAKVDDKAPAGVASDVPAVRPATSNAAATLMADPSGAPQGMAAIPSAAKPAAATMQAVVTAPLAVEPPAPAETAPSADATDAAAPVPEASALKPVPEPTIAAAAPDVSRGGLQPGSGRITRGVTLRSNPANGAPALGMLGAGTSVEIVSCKGWCEIVAGDKRGFVFQKFLTQG